MDPVDTTPTDQETLGTAPGGALDGEQGPNDDTPLDSINILPLLLASHPNWTKREAARVVESAKEDDESRADYMKRYANQLKLFASEIKTLGYPAQGAKAPHIAIMTKAICHLWARIYDQVVPAKGDIVKGKPLGPADEDRALRVEKHMNWQLRHRMPDWGISHQFTIQGWLIGGSRFRNYRWDPITRTHVIDDLPADDIIVSYTETDVHPQMMNVERVTRVLRFARWELEKYAELGFFSNLDAIFPDLKDPDRPDDEDGSTSDGDVLPASDDEQSVVRVAADKIQGVEEPKKKTKYSKREIYQQNMMLTFPKGLKDNGAGLAGQTKPVAFTVDKKTKKPLAVTIREIPDAVDQARFNQEMQAYEQAMVSAAQMLPPQQPGMMPPPPGASPQGPVNPGAGAAQGMAPPPKKPRPVRMQTCYRIIHYGLFPNPEGFYRLGIGTLLEGSNELADVLAAEYMLSAKFQNMITGFMSVGAQNKEGDMQVGHGKVIQTQLDPEMLDKGIKFLTLHPPSEGLMKVVEKLEQNSEIAASADILSGEKGASNETAKGMMVRNENAMVLISVMTRVYLEALKYELKLVACGNSVYLDEAEYFPFTEDVPGQPGAQKVTNVKIGRADYVEDVHLEFTADPRMTSKHERVSDAKDALEMIINSPLVQNPMLLDFAARQYWKASEEPGYIAAMGPPPQPPPPPTPQSQDTENAGFFNEKDHPVLPDDNHMAHLGKIDELQKSPLHEHLSSTGKQMLDRHKRAHVSQFYLQMQALQKNGGPPIHALAAHGANGGMGPGPAGGEAGPGAGGEEGPGAGIPANGSPGG